MLLVALLLLLPPVQNWLVQKTSDYVESSIGTEVSIDAIYLSWPNGITLKKLYVEDQQSDTLLYAEHFYAGLDYTALLHGEIEIGAVELENAVANIIVSESDSSFNFDYIITAFTPADTLPKDTTKAADTSAMDIDIGSIEIANTRFTYSDKSSGLNMHYDIGRLYAETKEFDLKNSIFYAEQIELENSSAQIFINKTSPTDTSNPELPKMKVGSENVLVQNTSILFNSKPEKIVLKSEIGKLKVSAEPVYLNKQSIAINDVILNESTVLFKQGKVEGNTNPDSIASAEEETEPWKIALANLEINKLSLGYKDEAVQAKEKGIDFANLNLALMHSKIENIYFNAADSIGAKVEEFAMQESSGFSINQMQADIALNPHSLEIKNALLRTGNSLIQRNFVIRYASLEKIGDSLSDLGLQLSIDESYIGFADLDYFVPSLVTDTSMQFLQNKTIYLNGKVSGKLNNLNIQDFTAKVPDSTLLAMEGNIKNILEPEHLIIDLPLFHLQTTAYATKSFLPDSSIPKNIQLPYSINFRASASGNKKDLQASIDLKTSFGNLDGDFHLQSNDSTWKNANYEADFVIPSFELDKFLKDTTFGSFSFNGKIDGHGLSPENIYAKLDAELSEFEYSGYQYSDMQINGLLDQKMFTGELNMNDSNLIFTFDGMANLDTNNTAFDFTLDVKAADLQHLGLYEEDLRLKGVLSSEIQGNNLNNLKGKVELRNFLIIHNGENYPVDSLLFVSITDSNKTDISIESTVLSGHFKGTIHLADIYPSLKDHLYSYLSGKDVKDAKTAVQNFDFELLIHDEDILTDILVPDLHRFVTGKLTGKYNSSEKKLELQLYFPLIEYQDFIIDSLYFVAQSNKDQLNYTLNLDQIAYDTLSINNVLLEGILQNDSLINTFSISESNGETFFQLAAAVTDFQNIATMKFLDRSIFDYQKWAVNPENKISLGENFKIENLRFSKGSESLSLNSSENSNNIELKVENFQLANFTSIISTEEESGNRFGLEDWDTSKVDTTEVKEENPLIAGIIDGTVSFPMDSLSAIAANLDIRDIKASGIPVGDVHLSASEIGTNSQKINASLSGNGNNMSIKGKIVQNESMDLDVNIEKLKLKSVEPFVAGQLKNSEGYFSGQAEVSGSFKEPRYSGHLEFHNIEVRPTYLGVRYSIPEERINFSNSEIKLDNFTVYDSLDNSFAIDGSIFIEKLTNPSFDLLINSEEFLFLNTSKQNKNDLFYGRMIMSSKIDVSGDLDEPVIVANVSLEEGSDLTFIVPNDQPVSVEQEGLVEFVDMDNNLPALLTEDKSIDTVKMDVLGMDLEAFVDVSPETEVTIVIDPVTGDHLLLKGGGEFRSTIDPSGTISLNGLYQIQEGSYELRLYNLVRRRFEIQPGSNIIWNGDPLTAEMDIDAIYEVKASPIDLLGSQLTHLSQEQQYMYSQKLDFEVILMLNGELMKPEISFELQLDENDRGAMGGIVLSKLNEINNNPSELNKQVFALLVLRRFISQDPFASNENAGVNLARQSVSRLLNQQLNSLTGDYIKGFQIELNVDSYQDFNTEGEQVGRTEVGLALSKSLFNERIVVKVNNDFDVEGERATAQANNSSSFAGDISVEYLITEDGKYRIKFFRDNNYEGIIEGQLIETGVSLIFAKDYENFHDLFKKKEEKRIQEQQQEQENQGEEK